MNKRLIVVGIGAMMFVMSNFSIAEEASTEATSTPTWTVIELPAARELNASGSRVGPTTGQGTTAAALGILEIQKNRAAGGIVYGGNNNTIGPAEGEGDWTGNGMMLVDRSGVAGSSAAVVTEASTTIPVNTEIVQIRIKATICGYHTNNTTQTASGTCAVGVGHTRTENNTTTLFGAAAAQGLGGAGVDTSITAVITYSDTAVWRSTDKILFSMSVPSTVTGTKQYFIRIDELAYLTYDEYLKGFDFVKTLNANENDSWSSDWDADVEGDNVPESESSAIILSEVDDSIEITTSASAASLETRGGGKVTFTASNGASSLQVGSLSVCTDTDVSGIISDLGDVNISDGKTLILGSNTASTVTSIAGAGNVVLGEGLWRQSISANEITLTNGTERIASGALSFSKITANAPNGFAAIYRDTVTNGANPYTWPETTVITGTGSLVFGGTSGAGGSYLPITLTASDDSDFTGDIYTVNRFNNPCRITLSGAAFKNAVYKFQSQYNNQVPNCLKGGSTASLLYLAGAVTLAGIDGGSGESVLSSNSESRTLTLSLAEGGEHTFAGTFGSEGTPLSVVKAGAGTQNIGTAYLQDMTITGGTISFGSLTFAESSALSLSPGVIFKVTNSVTIPDNAVITVTVPETSEIGMLLCNCPDETSAKAVASKMVIDIGEDSDKYSAVARRSSSGWNVKLYAQRSLIINIR